MIPAVSSHSTFHHKEEEASCSLTLCERVQKIWNSICTWICELAGWLCGFEQPPLILINRGDIALSSVDAFHKILTCLPPEDVGRCERVNRAWHAAIPLKEERVWKTLCKQEHVDYQPKAGEYKRAFSHPCLPTFAFGPSRWRRYFGDPGRMPLLPACIHRKLAILKDSCTLTLIPAMLDGEPLTINSFAPYAEKQGVNLIYTDKFIRETPHVSEPRSLWVFMKKRALEDSEKMAQADAKKESQLGKALWITVSAVAHFVQNKLKLFAGYPLFYMRCSDEEEDTSGGRHFVQVGGAAPALLGDSYSLYILLSGDDPEPRLYVLPTAPVLTFNAV